MIPRSRPRAHRHVVESAALELWRKDPTRVQFPEIYLLGVRGYYRDSMGKPGVNDRGIYDDAIFVVGPETFVAFNANTDPSVCRKGIASLVPGWYPYKPGNHGITRPGGGYPAFRPATKGEELPVKRDGDPNVPSGRPGVAINIHRGSRNSTSSEGCQTIHPDQWDTFHSLVSLELKKAGLKTFWYGLTDGPIV